MITFGELIHWRPYHIFFLYSRVLCLSSVDMLLCWLTLKNTADCCIPIFHILNLCLFSSHIVVNIMKFYTTALQVIGFAKFTKTVQSISFCIRKCLYLVWRTYFFFILPFAKGLPVLIFPWGSGYFCKFTYHAYSWKKSFRFFGKSEKINN